MTDYVIMPGADYQAACDVIREKTGSSDAIKSGDMAAAIGGIEGGDKWQGLREVVASKTSMHNFFNSSTMTELPNGLDTSNCTNFTQICANCTKLLVPLDIDTSKGTTFSGMYLKCHALAGVVTLDIASVTKHGLSSCFQDCNNLRKIVLKNASAISGSVSFFAFACRALEEIEGVLDFSGVTETNNTFTRNDALAEIRFVAGSIKVGVAFVNSSLLSDESIQSIVDGLADLTGQTAQTLTLHSSVISRLTSEQLAAITAKNWTLG